MIDVLCQWDAVTHVTLYYTPHRLPHGVHGARAINTAQNDTVAG